MFCSKCGNQLREEVQFCPNCGNAVSKNDTAQISKEAKVMLDPSEIVNHTENNEKKTTSGHAGTYGFILMIVSIIISLISMVVIGSDAFIPITIAGTALFVIGFLMRMFCS